MSCSRLLTIAAVCLLAFPSWAATFTVNSTADIADVSPGNGLCATGRTNPDGRAECTLRAAVQEAAALAGADEVIVPAGTYGLSLSVPCTYKDHGNPYALTVSSRSLCVSDETKITGAGASSTIIDGMAASRVVFVSDGSAATFRGVTIQNGLQTGGTYDGGGAGINNQGTLTIIDSSVSNNTCDAGAGGGIYTAGSLTVRNSLISNNSQIRAEGDGGGIWVYDGSLVVSDTTFSGNAVGNGGGAIGVYHGTVDIVGSSFLNNTAFGGGGVRSYYGTVFIANSTFSGNVTSGPGGALRTEQSGAMYLNNVTITQNKGDHFGGGGIYGGLAPVYMRNSILAGNSSIVADPSLAQDCLGTIVSQGYNLIQNTTSCTIAGDLTGNIIGQDAQLGALSLNGGGTQTIPLLGSSPAINAGSPVEPGSGDIGCTAFDQRGIIRPQGRRCDMGAFERDSAFAASKIAPGRGGNTGSTIVIVSGSGLSTGASVRLRRSGQADIAGSPATVEPGGFSLSSSLDLSGAAAGAWDVVVTNADASAATLPGAFLVQSPEPAKLWSYVVGRSAVRPGVPVKYTIVFGNRGNVDAYAVPLMLSTPGNFGLTTYFDVTPPPAQTGQVATDWSVAPLAVLPYSLQTQLHAPFLIPVVPAGFSGTMEFSLLLEPSIPHGTEFMFSAILGDPILNPGIDPTALQRMVDGAIAYAQTNLGVAVPSSAVPSIQAYVSNQLQLLVVAGRDQIVSSLGTLTLVASLAQLNVDAGRYAASPTVALPFRSMATSLTAGGGGSNPCTGRVLAPGESCGSNGNPLPPPDDSKPNKNGIPPSACKDIPKHHLTGDGKACVPDSRKGCPTIPTPFFTDPDCMTYPVVNSYDPNEKTGPTKGANITAQPSSNALPYVVSFENQSTASGAAQQVVITDQLDLAKVDLSTFSLGPLSFGNTTVVPPPSQTSYVKILDMRPAQDLLVKIDAALNSASGLVTWRFTTLDPLTGKVTDDPLLGFLPPNDAPPAGEGHVLFTVQPKLPVTTGTQICNQASIVFDFNARILTNPFCNTIDDLAPVSRVQTLPAQLPSSTFNVQWSGKDTGSAINDFDIFASDNGGPFALWLQQTGLNQSDYTGMPGHTYSFFSIARDQAGNVEGNKIAAEATTSIGTTTACASNVSATVQVTKSGFVYNRTTGRFVQTVTLKNSTGSLIAGPISLVLDELSGNATLSNSSGVTVCATPSGRPFIVTSAGLNPGASTSIVLQFADPAKMAITYVTRVLAGSSR